MVNIALIGIVVTLLALLFKNTKEEFAILISIAGCFLIMSFGIPKLQIIIDAINKIQNYISINENYIVILIKIIGITLISEIASNICKDCKHNAVANQIELFGKLTILATGMPILMALLDTISEFLTV
ncbi:MAG: stage III sporulation protein AD [Clostridiales bacterium]|nr:stage III sporulation protein AD [Clostridiales bacterium]